MFRQALPGVCYDGSCRGELGFDGDGMFVELHQDVNLVVPAVTIPYNLLSLRFESVCSQ